MHNQEEKQLHGDEKEADVHSSLRLPFVMVDMDSCTYSAVHPQVHTRTRVARVSCASALMLSHMTRVHCECHSLIFTALPEVDCQLLGRGWYVYA